MVSGNSEIEPEPLHDVRAAGMGTEIDLIKTSS